MSLSSCSRMWQWKAYFCVPLTPGGSLNGERILVTTRGFAETVSLKPWSSVWSGSGPPV